MTFISMVHLPGFSSVVADTATSRIASAGRKPIGDYTFFEQRQTYDDVIVEETINKVCRIGNREIAAFTGDVETGTRILLKLASLEFGGF